MPDFVSSLLRFVLKLVLGPLAVVGAVRLLASALVVLAFTLLKALITGKKPAAAMVFSRFQGYAPQDLWGRKTKPAGQVVDVEVRELREVEDGVDDTPAQPMRTPPAQPMRTPPALHRSAPASDVTDATDVTDKNAARPADATP